MALLDANKEGTMNLMFWKKQAGAEAESPVAQSGKLKNLTTPKLAARIKLWFAALTGHFRKPPAFRADDGRLADAPCDSEDMSGATVEPELEAADPEMLVKPALAARIKLQFVSLVKRFRKTSAIDPEEDHSDSAESSGSPAPEIPAKPGLLMRINAGFAAFIREIKAPVTPQAGEDEGGADRLDRSEAAHEEGEISDSAIAAGPVRSRKWLVVSGSILIAVLLVTGIAINFWQTYEPKQKRWGTKHDITSISSTPSGQESTPDLPHDEVDALKKKNAELQARIEALQKAPPPQRSYIPSARQSGGSSPSFAGSGDTMLGTSDPKAAAMTLKEAIEAMNASSGDYGKNNTK
ncbi:MAG: hypothetical protein A3F73_00575 [Gallionellales bacterium RIFCSPLOWO2_12_FULL_59_22]|nr:MAG: hypothetical protein A3F73_00575 [Gallionellales bacterium RIFCSPLOWO2_12_FULL_59_22]